MSEPPNIEDYLRKATESLAGAESEYASERFNNCANRAYYASFQAAIAALLREGIRSAKGNWSHAFVQTQFASQIINRRHRYPSALRSTLSDILTLRLTADYDPDPVSRAEANRSLRRSREFRVCRSHQAGRRSTSMTPEQRFPRTPRMREAIVELKELIRFRYPEATFDVTEGEDPDGIYLVATVDVDDRNDVIDLFLDRLVDFQVEEELPIYVVPRRTPARNAAILAQQQARAGAALATR